MTVNLLLTKFLRFIRSLNVAIQPTENTMKDEFESRYSVRMNWSWEDRTFGWAGSFSEFGVGVLIVGPLFITLTWPCEFTLE